MSSITTFYVDEQERRVTEQGMDFLRCGLCDPERSEEALFTIPDGDWIPMIGRHIVDELGKEEYVNPAFPISEVERLKLFLDGRLKSAWPNSPIISFDVLLPAVYLIDPSDKNPETAVVRVDASSCCGLYRIGHNMWRWDVLWEGHTEDDPA